MRGLPVEYAIRNLMRHPLRTFLTAGASALVTALLVATTSFVRGLEGTFAGAAQSDTAILLSNVAQRDVVRSSVSAGLPHRPLSSTADSASLFIPASKVAKSSSFLRSPFIQK